MKINRTYLAALAFSAIAQGGCAVEGTLEGVGSEELQETAARVQNSSSDQYFVYAFNGGSWRRTRFLGTSTTGGSTQTFSFGASNDVPLLGFTDQGDVIIGTFGTSGSRKGFFFLDKNGDYTFGGSDSSTKFLSSPQTGDKPFVLYAQIWHRPSGSCVPKVNVSDGLEFPVFRAMVGIKRGTTTFLDRDGDGVFQANANNCDLSTSGFGISSDLPVSVPWQSAPGTNFGTTNTFGGPRDWFFDNNNNLTWDFPSVDSLTLNNGFGDNLMFVPSSHPAGMAVQSGRTVHFDYDGSRHWTVGDLTYSNVLPSTSWALVGVEYRFLP